jgi:hypothetical protein
MRCGRCEERVPIEEVDDIYKYADRLKAAVSYYIEQGTKVGLGEKHNSEPTYPVSMIT